MKQTGKCPKCDETDIIADAHAVDHGHMNVPRDVSVATFRSPTAIVFKGRQQTSMSAWICVRCGYIEFYADSPDRIKVPGTSPGVARRLPKVTVHGGWGICDAIVAKSW